MLDPGAQVGLGQSSGNLPAIQAVALRLGDFFGKSDRCREMPDPGLDNLGPVRPILDRFWTDAEAGISEYEYFLEFELVVTCRDVA